MKMEQIKAPTAGEMVAFLRTVPPSTKIELGNVVYDGIAVTATRPEPPKPAEKPKRSRRSRKSD